MGLIFQVWLEPTLRDHIIARLLAFNFQTPLWIFPIFGIEVVLMVFFVKIILCWENCDMAKFGHLRPIFCHNWQLREFLAYNFQTLLRIFLIFDWSCSLIKFAMNKSIFEKLWPKNLFSWKSDFWRILTSAVCCLWPQLE